LLILSCISATFALGSFGSRDVLEIGDNGSGKCVSVDLIKLSDVVSVEAVVSERAYVFARR
jgi:hypothetical protein